MPNYIHIDIHIDNYNTLHCHQNRHGEGAVCYISNNLRYDIKYFFQPEIKNIFFKILLQNTKPIVIGIIYQLPTQSDFSEIINTYFNKFITNDNEIYILDDFNINVYLNKSYVFQKNNLLQSHSIPCDIKKYYDSVLFGLKQLIEDACPL